MSKLIIHKRKQGNGVTGNSRRKLRRNPPLVTFANPQRILSNDAIEIRYKHRKDGEFYKHKFERGKVRICLNEDGSVTLYHTGGKSLWGDF